MTLMHGTAMLVSRREGMLIGADLSTMSLMLAMVPMMGCTAALTAHRGTGTAADMTAALAALMGLMQHLLVAFGLLNGASGFKVFVVRLVMVRMMRDRGVVRDLAALGVGTPVMEALMTFHVVSPLRAYLSGRYAKEAGYR